nr:uncharacterized protein LOC114822466 [Malus domestica]
MSPERLRIFSRPLLFFFVIAFGNKIQKIQEIREIKFYKFKKWPFENWPRTPTPLQLAQSNHRHHRSTSPTRVNLYTFSSLSPSVRFSINHRSISPNHHSNRSTAVSKKTRSFRCSLHKNQGGSQNTGNSPLDRQDEARDLCELCRSDMTNSPVQIDGLEGDEWRSTAPSPPAPSTSTNSARQLCRLLCLRHP